MLLIFSVNTHELLLRKIKKKQKPNKIWVDKGSKFYNRSMKSFLQNSNIEMYSTHNEGKSVVA